MNHRILVVIVLLLTVFQLGNASDLPHSRTSSYYKYIYQLNPKQARAIYKNGLAEVDESYFHTLTDSVPNDSVFNTKLPQGNYLLVWAQQNELKFEMRSYTDIDVMIHNNYADLLLTIADTTGKVIDNAKVKINGSVVRYKPDLEAYQKLKSNQRGWLEVTHNGFTSYHYLGNEVNKGVKFRKVIFSVPVKYIYIPLRLLVFLPYDLVMTAYNGRPQGLPYYMYKPFKDTYLSIFRYGTYGWINRLVRTWEKTFDKSYEGYMVFSQPKYKPNDTVRFKACILRPNGSLISKQPLEASIRVKNKVVKLTDLEPNRRGVYSYEFVLHDSLEMKLDKNYYVSLKRGGWNALISRSFRYEEYELNNIKYKLRTDKSSQLKGKPFFVYLKGEDMNGLNVPDGRVILTIKSKKQFSKLYAYQAYLKDTLYRIEKNLDPVGETMIEIPDSIFPAMDFTYNLEAVFLTSDNERVQKNKSIPYYYDKKEISLKVQNDSVHFSYQRLDKEDPIKAEVTAFDKNGNVFDQNKVELPYGEPVNNQVAAFRVKTAVMDKYFDLSKYAPSLSISSNRTHQEVAISVVNPKAIWFNYFVYKKDKELAHGYTQQLDTIVKLSGSKGCFVSLNYQWAGESYNQSFDIPLYKKQLRVTLNQPQVIYPGQKTNITVEVKDYKNRPVKGVDLTAYGLTKKFNYNPPTLNYYGKSPKSRTMYNNYNLLGDKNFGKSSSLLLDYDLWRPKMALDTITYYQFVRPNKGAHIEHIPSEDDVTQFAPFVFKNGVFQQVHFIFLDYDLLYSSIATTQNPYSFKCRPGYHTLRLRTTTEDITIDSVYFKYGQKNLIAIDPLKVEAGVTVEKRKAQMTGEEERLIRTRYARFYLSTETGLVYLYQRQKYFILKKANNRGKYHTSNYNQEVIAGPFLHEQASFIHHNKYSTPFKFESSYQYGIDKRLIKMKTYDHFWHFNQLTDDHIIPDYTDMVLTSNAIERMSKEVHIQKAKQYIQYHNPYSTKKGNGTLAIDYETEKDNQASLINILVFKDDDPLFMRIYPSNTTRVYDLKPGSYRLFFSMQEGYYHEKKDILVSAYGMSALKVIEPDSLLKDETSAKISKLIKNKWLADRSSNYSSQKWYAEREIKSTYIRSQLDYSNSRVIIGKVVDADDELGIPGASVVIKGTTIGTISDMDGNYRIEIPEGDWELEFLFIGYQSVEVPVSYSEEINVALAVDKMALDEVVVVGYGTQRKSSVTGSITKVSSSAIQGRLAGVSLAPGSSPNIRVRGGGSVNANGEPLIIVDGVPVDYDMSKLDASMVAEMNVLKEEAASAIYGSSGANGVILITTKSGQGLPGASQLNDIDIPLQAINSNSLRSNFSDMAFWQPDLVTNNKGEATFASSFPDDITSWSTFALAVSKKKQTGQVQGEIKSFKPVSAQLMVPRFLTQGDSVKGIGKSVNYLNDSIHVQTSYQVDSTEVDHWDRKIGRVCIDSLTLEAKTTDTLSVTYSLERENGYFDGEQRKISVIPAGIEEAEGEFYTMSTDTLISFILPENYTQGLLYLESNPMNILLKETQHLRSYAHLCNEQASSKLIALLNEEMICNYQGTKFKYKKDIDVLIRRLLKSTNDNNVWGWWSGLETQWWITAHVVEALEKAAQAGYKVTFNKEQVKYQLINRYAMVNTREKLNILQTLKTINAEIDYPSLFTQLNDSSFSRIDSIRVAVLKQKVGVDVDISSFLQNRKETIYGNYYWGKPSWSLYYGQIQETLMIYSLLKDNGAYDSWLPKIRNFFYESRSNRGWRNTYESSLIINQLLPDLLVTKNNSKESELTIKLNGKAKAITQFPYSQHLNPNDTITISKTGDQVIFAGWHSKYFNDSPKVNEDYYKIETLFKKNGESIEYLTAGEKVTLQVNIDIRKKSDYLLLEIPIPSVCSYHNKPQRCYPESHREYHKEKVSIYYRSLWKGKYQVEIELVPRYSGKVILNPSRMEHMYFPVFYGNNEVKEVKIEGR